MSVNSPLEEYPNLFGGGGYPPRLKPPLKRGINYKFNKK
jgi:hypothetical protein